MNTFIQQYSIPISLSIRIISCGISLLFCIPLQIKETRVRNGLRKLRIELLLFGVVLLGINVMTMCLLWNMFIEQQPQVVINAYLQCANALGFLLLSILGFLMYHQQYTQENKDFHDKVSDLEQHPPIAI